jgi:hypothetical protein
MCLNKEGRLAKRGQSDIACGCGELMAIGKRFMKFLIVAETAHNHQTVDNSQ